MHFKNTVIKRRENFEISNFFATCSDYVLLGHRYYCLPRQVVLYIDEVTVGRFPTSSLPNLYEVLHACCVLCSCFIHCSFFCGDTFAGDSCTKRTPFSLQSIEHFYIDKKITYKVHGQGEERVQLWTAGHVGGSLLEFRYHGKEQKTRPIADNRRGRPIAFSPSRCCCYRAKGLDETAGRPQEVEATR